MILVLADLFNKKQYKVNYSDGKLPLFYLSYHEIEPLIITLRIGVVMHEDIKYQSLFMLVDRAKIATLKARIEHHSFLSFEEFLNGKLRLEETSKINHLILLHHIVSPVDHRESVLISVAIEKSLHVGRFK